MDSSLISEARKAIPSHCFRKSTSRSLAHMAFDLLLFSTSIWTYPAGQGLLAHLLYWNVYGFLGWCIFVVGHDCGHGTFSHSKLLNAVCGHLCHGLLMVPFFPWARSHHQHHCYHNHKEKDRSYPWRTELEFETFPWIMWYLLPTAVGPFIGYWVYLFFGMSPDGCHIVWFGELYQGASNKEKLKCVLSTTVVLAWVYVVYLLTGSLVQFWLQYGFVIGATYLWLFMVTWFQHHDENTLVYDDDHWTFTKGALQTVDRTMGYGLDWLHHRITDCHIVHHMYFTGIPHYHLREATDALYAYADEKQVPLKRVDHSAYPFKFVVDFFKLYPRINILRWSYGK